MIANAEESALVVIDPQPKFMGGIFESARVLSRIRFLVEVANLLDIPVLITEQNPEKMGGCDPDLLATIGKPAISKMEFGAWLNEGFADAFSLTGRSQAIIVGIETHICVCQTANQMMNDDYEVFVVGDAVSARTEGMHKMAIKRLRDAGAAIAHSESIAYEWMQSADHPRFREVLNLVKAASV